MKLTLQISKGEEFFIGQIKEFPKVLSQGATKEEVRENIMDALELYLLDIRETIKEDSVHEEELFV